jgi:hypothetical protein
MGPFSLVLGLGQYLLEVLRTVCIWLSFGIYNFSPPPLPSTVLFLHYLLVHLELCLQAWLFVCVLA